MTVQVDYNDAQARQLINELRRRMGDISTVMEAVGQVIQSGTQQRFVDQKAPDGTPWAALSPVTLERRRKKGAGAQILRDTGRLMNSISYRVSGNTVTVFTNTIYAGIQQKGGKKSQFPHLWGDIPARPFLGPNADDTQAVLQVLQGYLQADQNLTWWERLVKKITGFFL